MKAQRKTTYRRISAKDQELERLLRRAALYLKERTVETPHLKERTVETPPLARKKRVAAA